MSARAAGRAVWAWAIASVLARGALTFVPALVLGPVVEHFLMHAGNWF